MKRRLISLSLSTCLLLGSSVFAAGANKIEESNKVTSVTTEAKTENINTDIKELNSESDYITYEGTITEVNKSEKSTSILVENKDNEGFKSIRFNISEDVYLLSNKTKDFINKDELKEGMKINVFYGKNTPMTKSLPPIANPSVVVVNESEEPDGVKVDRFNDQLISTDNFLKANISDKTIIVDKNGNKLEKEDIYNKDLIVFYGPIMTMSIPAQSHANKIILLESEVKTLDKITVNGQEKELKNKIYKSGKSTMIPLRDIAEVLEYKVTWNNDLKVAELIKGNNFVTVKPNEDNYSFAKMIVKLGVASELKDGNTYVPLSFLDKVLKLDYEITKSGVINIK
ncbi:copper amine oxidase domain-containing protein [Gottschalkia acidurici 9a]|uniref:Copper amine oxidase domain-containing protein n=1 Tax=Gottschalkia acidurici (strain ATCC 7906 / DSM 604 / BCRC 14475 / CIP 104303 / KCTC 5404 / NCIMB 10678 / 9a) TaxID=1128398 RepID=K0B524_GOTA9|nr:copper amine oxidase N-terminal domain-containing protein [Gottschalkia acidurici]AFS79661.1 copper amine oxidase domain-containing protein [Gottschalkia acidurici 9a]